jgi:hypothetical protein
MDPTVMRMDAITNRPIHRNNPPVVGPVVEAVSVPLERTVLVSLITGPPSIRSLLLSRFVTGDEAATPFVTGVPAEGALGLFFGTL